MQILFLRFRHLNILQVMGYCCDVKLKAVVYEFMRNGSLYQWIHDVSCIHIFYSSISSVIV